MADSNFNGPLGNPVPLASSPPAPDAETLAPMHLNYSAWPSHENPSHQQYPGQYRPRLPDPTVYGGYFPNHYQLSGQVGPRPPAFYSHPVGMFQHRLPPAPALIPQNFGPIPQDSTNTDFMDYRATNMPMMDSLMQQNQTSENQMQQNQMPQTQTLQGRPVQFQTLRSRIPLNQMQPNRLQLNQMQMLQNSMPQSQMLQSQMPQSQMPQSQMPQSSRPQSSRAQSSILQNSRPQNQMQDQMPQSSRPQNTMAQNPGPQNQVQNQVQNQMQNQMQNQVQSQMPQHRMPPVSRPQSSIPQNSRPPNQMPQGSRPQNRRPYSPRQLANISDITRVHGLPHYYYDVYGFDDMSQPLTPLLNSNPNSNEAMRAATTHRVSARSNSGGVNLTSDMDLYERAQRVGSRASGILERRPSTNVEPLSSHRPQRSISPRSNRRSFDRYSTDLSPTNNIPGPNSADHTPTHRSRRPRTTVMRNMNWRADVARAIAQRDPNFVSGGQIQRLKDKLTKHVRGALAVDVSPTCEICQKDYSGILVSPTENEEVAVELACKHVFGEHCIHTWFETCKTQKNKVTCPMCRTVLIETLRSREEVFQMMAAQDVYSFGSLLQSEQRRMMAELRNRDLEGDFANA